MSLDFGIDVSIDLQDVRPAVIIVINEAATPSNVLVVDADSRGECNVTKGSVAVVVIEVARVVGEVGLENIKPSVAVIIGDGNAHSGLFVAILAVGAAGDHRDIGESAVVVVVEEDAGFGIHGDINIGPAVIIKIIGHGSDGIPRAGLEDSGLRGDIGEGAVAAVVKKDVVSPEAAKQIVPPIVVVIADAHARLPAGAGQAGPFCDVGEGSVAIVLVKMRGGGFAGWPVGIDAGSVGEIDVEPAVVVIIEKSQSAALRFDDVFFVIGAAPDIGNG